MNKSKGKIYKLVCPDLGHARYVGQTIRSLDDRLRDHLRKATKRKTRSDLDPYWVDCWICSVEKGEITIELIEEVPREQLDRREKHWISEFRSRYPDKLTNIADGGSNPTLSGEEHPLWGEERSEECKEKISEKNSGSNNGMSGTNLFEVWKGKYGEEEARVRFDSWKEKTRQRMVESEKFQTSRKSEEFREKMSRVKGMTVYLLNDDLDIVQEFQSCTKASDWLGCTRGNVKNARREERQIQRQYWVVSKEEYRGK